MKASSSRRFRRRSTQSNEFNFLKKESNKEHTFFGNTSHETFFQPNAAIQRKCENCKEEEKVQRLTDKKEEEKKVQRQPEKKEEEKKVMKKENGVSSNPVTGNYISTLSGGQALPKDVNHFYGSRMGRDFSDVKIHNNKEAAQSAQNLNARAYTVGNHIVFNDGQLNYESHEGKKLLAHELRHVVQQNNSAQRKIQRAAKFSVTQWDAEAVAPAGLGNTADYIVIPKGNQIILSALVESSGDAADNCSDVEFGTTQTAWLAWVKMYYYGRTAADGSMVVSYKASVPIRDPAPAGNIWYNDNKVETISSCGDGTGVFHKDGPWHELDKTRTNETAPGKPLNYLTGYSRGLHLVTYLTGKKIGGNFFNTPLKFRYWNSIQDFTFTPNYASPASVWASAGQVKVNIGSAGSGETTDAPYYTTAGTTYNTHFNANASWVKTEKK